jgi:hypothetical protein
LYKNVLVLLLDDNLRKSSTCSILVLVPVVNKQILYWYDVKGITHKKRGNDTQIRGKTHRKIFKLFWPNFFFKKKNWGDYTQNPWS